MKNYKVLNLFDLQGHAQYKGLDLSKIVAGSQIYPIDENVAYLKYVGEDVIDDDLELLTDDEYNAIKEKEDSSRPKSPIEELTLQNEELQRKQDLMQAAIDDLIFGGML